MAPHEMQPHAPLIAGFGMTRDVSVDILLDVFTETLKAAKLEAGAVTGLATLAIHADLPVCRELATRLGLELHAVEEDELPKVDDRVITRSERILKRFGTGSVAEAAALLVAGPDARILAPRLRAQTARCSATCALAGHAGETA